MKEVDGKTCTKCGEFKPLGEFSKDKSKKGGLGRWCKLCYKEYKRKYYEENREKYLERSRKYYQENREKYNERSRKYRQENREKIREYDKKYHQENQEKIKEYNRYRRETLSDSYIKSLFSHRGSPLTAADIPQELIELKRAQLQIARNLKEKR